jgi:hypothetical protein
MNFLKIKKNGKLIKEEIVNGKTKTTEVKNLSEHLSHELYFEEGLKFKTFFDLILKEKEIFSKIFKNDLNGLTLDYFENQIKKRQSIKEIYGDDDALMVSLEITKIFELLSFEKGSTIELYSVFVGVGIDEEGDEIMIPINLIPINNLKNYEIRMNKGVEIFRGNENGEIEDEDPFLMAGSSITLYETLQTMLFEISYFGTEEEKLKEKENQEKEETFLNKIDELEDYLEKLVQNEEYEKAAKTKKEIEKLKKLKK